MRSKSKTVSFSLFFFCFSSPLASQTKAVYSTRRKHCCRPFVTKSWCRKQKRTAPFDPPRFDNNNVTNRVTHRRGRSNYVLCTVVITRVRNSTRLRLYFRTLNTMILWKRQMGFEYSVFCKKKICFKVRFPCSILDVRSESGVSGLSRFFYYVRFSTRVCHGTYKKHIRLETPQG